MMEKNLLRTDDLHHLKEGEIYTDPETGKKYRVRKTLLPEHLAGGPHGLGDPNDRTLRRIEADVVVPNLMNLEVERVECHQTHIDLMRCLKSSSPFSGLRVCRALAEIYSQCKLEKFRDAEFRERITEEYLKERSEVRRTGMTAKQREFQAFRETKNGEFLNNET